METLEPPPGFQGLRQDLPVVTYQRHLPHWRQEGATYFITFRLADALPLPKQEQLRDLKAAWERRHPHPQTPLQKAALMRILGQKTDRWLDRGMGACLLQTPTHRGHLIEALHHFDRNRRVSASLPQPSQAPPRYEMDAYVIMPNHVHAMVRPLSSKTWPLEKLTQHWKRRSARAINLERGTSGACWSEESFDRIIRDSEHLWHCLQYIGNNPVKANLTAGTFTRWVRPEWDALGWSFPPLKP